MRAFISHIHEDADLAVCLKSWIEESLLGQGNAFMSSDAASLPLGSKWLETISARLEDSKVQIVLCSPKSLSRPWINFETGCAWSRNIPVIPICYSGQAKANLPRPLGDFQAIDLTSADTCKAAMEAVALHCGLALRPRLSYGDMWSEVKAAMPAKVATSNAAASESLQVNSSLTASDGLSAEQRALLVALIDAGDDASVERLAGSIGISRQLTEVNLDFLEDKKLVTTIYNTNGYKGFLINARGRKALFALGLVK